MKKGGGSESTLIIGPTKSVLVYALRLPDFGCSRQNYNYYNETEKLYEYRKANSIIKRSIYTKIKNDL